MTTIGIHPLTASLRYVLEAHGVLNPLTGKPFTEALLLGIGGGLGAGYILWEFKEHGTPIIVLDFRNRWHKPVEFLTQLCQHLGITPHVQEASKKQAALNLQNALAAGKPCMVWADKAHLPYQQLPLSLSGQSPNIFAVTEVNADGVLVQDTAEKPYFVPMAEFVTARDRIVSDKNRIVTFTLPTSYDVAAAVRAGIANMLEHLSSPSDSFSLPVLRKWAKLLTHPKDKKSWLVVFKERHGLFATLRSIHEGIAYNGTEGYALRHLYAAFLTEAADVLKNPALNAVAEQYRAVSDLWRGFAESVLPDSVPQFAEAKRLVKSRYSAFAHNDAAGLRAIMDKLVAQEDALNGANFPLNDAATLALFEDMQARLNAIYDAEVAALDALKAAVS